MMTLSLASKKNPSTHTHTHIPYIPHTPRTTHYIIHTPHIYYILYTRISAHSHSLHYIVGMLIGILFAGQHTSGITSTWTGYFLHKHPEYLKEVCMQVCMYLCTREKWRRERERVSECERREQESEGERRGVIKKRFVAMTIKGVKSDSQSTSNGWTVLYSEHTTVHVHMCSLSLSPVAGSCMWCGDWCTLIIVTLICVLFFHTLRRCLLNKKN